MKLLSPDQNEMQMFEFLFKAVSHTQFYVVSFPSSRRGVVKVFFYRRIWIEVFQEVRIVGLREAKGFQIYTTPVTKALPPGGNMFKCTNEQLISSLFVLDGFYDCHGNNSG